MNELVVLKSHGHISVHIMSEIKWEWAYSGFMIYVYPIILFSHTASLTFSTTIPWNPKSKNPTKTTAIPIVALKRAKNTVKYGPVKLTPRYPHADIMKKVRPNAITNGPHADILIWSGIWSNYNSSAGASMVVEWITPVKITTTAKIAISIDIFLVNPFALSADYLLNLHILF